MLWILYGSVGLLAVSLAGFAWTRRRELKNELGLKPKLEKVREQEQKPALKPAPYREPGDPGEHKPEMTDSERKLLLGHVDTGPRFERIRRGDMYYKATMPGGAVYVSGGGVVWLNEETFKRLQDDRAEELALLLRKWEYDNDIR